MASSVQKVQTSVANLSTLLGTTKPMNLRRKTWCRSLNLQSQSCRMVGIKLCCEIIRQTIQQRHEPVPVTTLLSCVRFRSETTNIRSAPTVLQARPTCPNLSRWLDQTRDSPEIHPRTPCLSHREIKGKSPFTRTQVSRIFKAAVETRTTLYTRA